MTESRLRDFNIEIVKIRWSTVFVKLLTVNGWPSIVDVISLRDILYSYFWLIMIIEISLEMNNFSHQENPVNSNASTDSFIRRRRGAVRKQNVHEVKINPRTFSRWQFGDNYRRWRRVRWHKAFEVDSKMSIKSADRLFKSSLHRVSEDWTWDL